MDWPRHSSTARSPPQPERLPRLPSPFGPRRSDNSWVPQNRPSFEHPIPPNNDSNKSQQLPSLSTLLSPPLSDARGAPPSRDIPKSTSSVLERSPQPRLGYLQNTLGRDNQDHRASPRLPPTSVNGGHQNYDGQRQQPSEYYQPQPYRTSGPSPSVQRPSSRTSVRSRFSDQNSPDIPASIREGSLDPSTSSSKRRSDGTQRAPARVSRCVGKQHIDGEGTCYVYEDGSYCPTIIDGETVNPSWGITKAGKPRKRLAQACLTCREKKIKCDPAIPKCHQCAKSQRVCRGGLNETIQPLSKEEYGSVHSPSKRPSPSYSTPPQSHQNGSSEWERPAKLPRLNQDEFNTNGTHHHHSTPMTQEPWSRPPSVLSTPHLSHTKSFEPVNRPDPKVLLAPSAPKQHNVEHLALCWERDPSEAEPVLTNELLDLYFTHFAPSTYSLFPREKFMRWLKLRRAKSADDRMVLYCMLALGSVFSRSSDHQSVGRQFADIATYATQQRLGNFTLQLAHARLILTMYFFARGQREEAWDLCGSALRCISAMRLNTEEGVHEFNEYEHNYEFDRETLIECRRRAFWSGFLMDRFNGFCRANMCVFNLEDIFLRLPTTEHEYNTRRLTESPLFDYESLDGAIPKDADLGPMSYLVQISAIWGDIFCTTSRAAHRTDKSYNNFYETFYVTANRRLHAWTSILPLTLRNTQQNLDLAITNGYAGTFLSIHALYHASAIRLNRHVRTSILSAHQVRRNLAECISHSDRLLNMTLALAKPSRDMRLPQHGPNSNPTFAFSTPFPGFAFTLAIDVLSSAGRISHLPYITRAVRSGADCVAELSEFWASARAQHKTINRRLQQMEEVGADHARFATTDQGRERGAWRFEIEHAMDQTYARGMDLVYGVQAETLLTGVGESEFVRGLGV